MDNTVELSCIDTRYEPLRLPNKKREKDLLESISQRGIESPLQGISTNNLFILLDGFKRLRVARRLGINVIPVEVLASSESDAIIKLLQISNAKSLHILEQVQLVNSLHEMHGLKVREIATRLEKSPSWVSVRLGILKDFGPKVWEAVFKGNFPASNMLYTLRQFRRLNSESKSGIDDFVSAVSAKNLGHREIESLAHAWFKGGDEMREQIKKGDLAWTLRKGLELNPETAGPDLNENEKQIIQDLGIIQKYMARLMNKIPFMKDQSIQYQSTARSMARGILDNHKRFTEVLEKL